MVWGVLWVMLAQTELRYRRRAFKALLTAERERESALDYIIGLLGGRGGAGVQF